MKSAKDQATVAKGLLMVDSRLVERMRWQTNGLGHRASKRTSLVCDRIRRRSHVARWRG